MNRCAIIVVPRIVRGFPRRISATATQTAAIRSPPGSSTSDSVPPSVVEHEPATVYVNPICMQMDQLILKAAHPDDILTILVTQRGVLFVHNLLTALTCVADMAQQSVPFAKAKRLQYPDQFSKVERDSLLADPRYVLLIRDLIDHSGKLDLKSIDSILISLQKLDHCHYRLFGALLKQVYASDLGSTDVATALSIGQSLEWGGFGRAETFYHNLSLLVECSAATLPKRDFLNSLILFSKLDKLYVGVAQTLARQLPRRTHSMTSRELGIAALAVSEFGSVVDGAGAAVQAISQTMSESSSVRDLTRVAIGLRRTNIENRQFMQLAWTRGIGEIVQCSNLRERMDPSIATLSDLAMLVSSCAHFGVGSAEDLSTTVLPYIIDNVDVVTEEAAIRVLATVSMFPSAVTSATSPTVALLMRKVAASTDSWERHKNWLIHVFFSKIINFNFIKADLRKLVVDASLAHYLQARRGYGVPYPEVSKPLFHALSDCIDDMGGELMEFNQWIPDTPYNADILIPSKRIAVLVMSRFSSAGSPVGTDLLQTKHIESLGWKVIPVDKSLLLSWLKSGQLELGVRLISAQLTEADVVPTIPSID